MALEPTQPPIHWVTGALSLGVKRLGRKHSPPSSAKVKNALGYTSTSPYAFKEWYSVKKHRDNFIFTLPAVLHSVDVLKLISSDELILLNSSNIF